MGTRAGGESQNREAAPSESSVRKPSGSTENDPENKPSDSSGKHHNYTPRPRYWIHCVCLSKCPSAHPSVCSFLCELVYVYIYTVAATYRLFLCQFINIILHCIKAAIFNAGWRPPCCFLYWPQYSAYDTLMHITGPLV